jgi:glycosyltransferase involved in cell wall biosynthesis
MDFVSVVVTTKNEEWCIERCLKSIKEQTWENIEIIVVDNFSTDKTVEISTNYTTKVYRKGPERSAQRNFGLIEIASGAYAMYVDADMMLSPTLVENCVRKLKAEGSVGLFIPETVLGSSYWCKVRRFERSFYDATPIDGTRFFNRNAIIEIGGFDQELFIKGSGEDWDLDKKLKQVGPLHYLDQGSVVYEGKWNLKNYIQEKGIAPNTSKPMIFHDESRFDLIKYIKKKTYYSKGFRAYIEKWGTNDPDIKMQFGLYYRFLGVFTENGKWKRFLARPDLLLGMYLLRFLVGMVFLKSQYFGKMK